MIISYQAISFSHVAYVINKISSRAQHMNQPEQEEKHTHTQTNSFCGSVCRHFLASFAMCVLYFRLLNSKPNCKNMQAQLSFFVCTVAKSHFHVLEQWNWSMPFYFSWSHLNVRSLVWCFFFCYLVPCILSVTSLSLVTESRNSYHWQFFEILRWLCVCAREWVCVTPHQYAYFW